MLYALFVGLGLIILNQITHRIMLYVAIQVIIKLVLPLVLIIGLIRFTIHHPIIGISVFIGLSVIGNNL